MIALTREQITDIASNLDCGMNCYIEKETGSVKMVPVFEDYEGDIEPWTNLLNELKENQDKYVQIDQMETWECFELMETFAKSVENDEIRNDLFYALSKKHPFQNFKSIVDNSGIYHDKWITFKTQNLIEWVKSKLDEINMSETGKETPSFI